MDNPFKIKENFSSKMRNENLISISWSFLHIRTGLLIALIYRLIYLERIRTNYHLTVILFTVGENIIATIKMRKYFLHPLKIFIAKVVALNHFA